MAISRESYGRARFRLPRRLAVTFFFAAMAWVPLAPAQLQTPSSNDAVRVTLKVNEDGSRTAYQFDPANHKATATTTSVEGKPAGKTLYVLDDAGRFASGVIYGARGEFLFKSRYKYDPAGRLNEETQLTKDGVVEHKIVYNYDPDGKQTGYAVYDGRGKLLGKTTPIRPTTR
ncbi:MAG: hypothetical protein ACR2HH_02960 [Chthoniobacterales bacterium]